MSVLEQGKKLLQGFKSRIKEGFSPNRHEGFTGILGSNVEMDSVLASDQANTQRVNSQFDTTIQTYNTAYKRLNTKTDEYLNDPDNNSDYAKRKNYNVFINKSLNEDAIPKTNHMGCVKLSTLSNKFSLTADSAFNVAYSNLITSYDDNEKACKLWAADSSSNVYALAKNADNTFKCYHGKYSGANIDLSNIEMYYKPVSLYKILDPVSGSKYKCGLFKNGQFGRYNTEINMWNIPNMKVPMKIKKYNSQTYTTDDPAMSISSGWWGNSQPGTRNNWGYNKFPNDHAWWVGYKTPSDGPADGSKSYYYYYYTAPTNYTNLHIYAIFPNNQKLKINGENIPIRFNFNGYDTSCLSGTFKKGKNIIEVETPNGFPDSGFMMYVWEWENTNNVLFKTGDPGWGVSSTQVDDYNKINSIPVSGTTGIESVTQVTTEYNKCDPMTGGAINVNSITASWGRNCNNVSGKPLDVTMVRVRPNSRGECIQIAQLVVNAIEGGAIVNVARSASPSSSGVGWGGTIYKPIDGTQQPRPHPNEYHSYCRRSDYYQLNLSGVKKVIGVIYYNRSDCCSNRANGMTIELYNGNTLMKTLSLTGALTQSFNITA
jgi:hypothetical protein